MGGILLKLNFEIIDKTLLIQFDGELDHHSAEEVREEIDGIIESNNIINLIFDLSNMKFMDSSGIGVVIGRYKKVNKLGGKVGIINESPHVDRIFEMAGLYKIIKKFDSKEKALSNM